MTYKTVKFEATLKYNETGGIYRPITYPAYVGDPSPEIDANWEELLGGMLLGPTLCNRLLITAKASTVFITPEEKEHWGKDDEYLDPDTGMYLAV
jgi:hypothetical protein